MHTHRHHARHLLGLTACAALAFVLGTSAPASAQAPIWSGSVQGEMTITGNTLGLDGSDSAPGTSNGIGTFIADPYNFASSQDGTYPVGTTSTWTENGSSAVLDLPFGAPIVKAELMWACSVRVSGVPANPVTTPNTVTVRRPDGTTHVVAADGEVTGLNLASTNYQYYQRWADVTGIVDAGGSGDYTVSKVVGVEDADNSSLTACGWTLFVVYQDQTAPVRSFNIWMTAEKVCFTGAGCPAASNTTVEGFCTPEAPAPVSGRLFVTAMEGDARFADDALLLEDPDTADTFVALSGPNNAADNFFASQINDDAGELDVAGTFGDKNHYVNPADGSDITRVSGARQGWDITAVPLGDATYNPGVLVNSQNSTAIRLTTAGDDYIVSALGMEIDVEAPLITTTHVADLNRVSVGDVVTYTVTLTNDGATTADELSLCYTDPSNATYVGGSVRVNGATVGSLTQSDFLPARCLAGTGGIPLGSLAVDATTTVTLQYTITALDPSPAVGTSVLSTPSWRGAWSDPCVGDDPLSMSGTGAEVEIPGSRLQVTLTASPATPPNLITDDVITYTATVATLGGQDTPATVQAMLPIPTGTAYVPGSTTLNGTAVQDVAGSSPYASMALINSPGAAPGVVEQGDPAWISLQVKVTTTQSTIIENQASADIDGAGDAPPRLSNTTQTGVGGADVDGDDIIDTVDNCPTVYNPDQANHYDLTGYNPSAVDEGDVCDDTDGDGIVDADEDVDADGWDEGQETSATSPDTDGDALCDGAITVAACVGHEDRDGDRSRGDWGTFETSPIDSDTDNDGLCDGRQTTATDCTGSEDADGDGDPNDFGEVTDTETNPLRADTDGGGVNDGDERQNGTNPNDRCDGDLQPCPQPDQDNDGVPDADDNCPTTPNANQENNYDMNGYNPQAMDEGDACDDTDGDGLLDAEEDPDADGLDIGVETDATDPDTDRDALCDGATVVAHCLGVEDKDGDRDRGDWGTTETSPVDGDTDGDGLCDGSQVQGATCIGGEDLDGDGDPADFDEITDNETDPLNPDTDGGGVNDGIEANNGTNPRDFCDGDLDDCSVDYFQGGGGCQGGPAPGALLVLLGLLGVALLRRRRAA